MTITVLSLNTAVDRTLVVPNLRAGGVYRTADMHVDAGGKGLNVARTVRQLGDRVRVIGFLGGAPEAFIQERCAAFGIEQHWVRTGETSRTCVIVVDGKGGPPTVINEPGPTISGAELEELRQVVTTLVGPDDLLSISGSAPSGIPPGFLAEMVSLGRLRDARILVDTSEARLPEALDATPWAISPTLAEASGAVGSMTAAALATALAERAEHVLLTMGKDGALYATAGELWHLVPPAVTALNPIASGDALVAGFLSRMSRGSSGLQSAVFGVACGTCNAAQLNPGIPSPADVEAMAARVEVRRPGETGGT